MHNLKKKFKKFFKNPLILIRQHKTVSASTFSGDKQTANTPTKDEMNKSDSSACGCWTRSRPIQGSKERYLSIMTK